MPVTDDRIIVPCPHCDALNRVPRAQKVFARLRPLITQAQGELAPADVPGRLQQWAGGETATTGEGAAGAPSEAPEAGASAPVTE